VPKSSRITSWCVAIAVLLTLLTLNGASVAYAQGTWTSLDPVQCPDPVPCPSEGMTVGGVGQVIIGAYGFTPTLGGDTILTRLYNISTNSWSLGLPAPLPPRSEEAYGETTHGGFLYVIGGRSGLCPGPPAGVCNNLERYDPVTNTWATLTPMPTARAAAAAAVFDNSIYVIGGRLSGGGPCSGGPYLATVERYDIDTNTWSTVAPLPFARSDLAAREHGGKIYVFGGCNGFFTGFLKDVSVYDPVKDTWTSGLAPMPTARASLVAGISGDNVYAIGGWNGTGTGLTTNEVYNIAGDSWSTAAPMPTARGEAGSHSHGGRIYVVGGSQPAFGASTAANEVFKPNP
jgi:N-acetylneuraminic acid mutarotase